VELVGVDVVRVVDAGVAECVLFGVDLVFVGDALAVGRVVRGDSQPVGPPTSR
jgi:hypothetical protein